MRARMIVVLLGIGLMLAMTAGMAGAQELTDEVVIREIVDYDAQVPDIQPTTYNSNSRFGFRFALCSDIAYTWRK